MASSSSPIPRKPTASPFKAPSFRRVVQFSVFFANLVIADSSANSIATHENYSENKSSTESNPNTNSPNTNSIRLSLDDIDDLLPHGTHGMSPGAIKAAITGNDREIEDFLSKLQDKYQAEIISSSDKASNKAANKASNEASNNTPRPDVNDSKTASENTTTNVNKTVPRFSFDKLFKLAAAFDVANEGWEKFKARLGEEIQKKDSSSTVKTTSEWLQIHFPEGCQKWEIEGVSKASKDTACSPSTAFAESFDVNDSLSPDAFQPSWSGEVVGLAQDFKKLLLEGVFQIEAIPDAVNFRRKEALDAIQECLKLSEVGGKQPLYDGDEGVSSRSDYKINAGNDISSAVPMVERWTVANEITGGVLKPPQMKFQDGVGEKQAERFQKCRNWTDRMFRFRTTVRI
jgi:hypothetical protein